MRKFWHLKPSVLCVCTVWAWELLRCGGRTCHGLHERLRNVDCTTPLACALLPLLLLWWWLQATCPASGSSCATLTSQAPTCSCLESALRCVDSYNTGGTAMVDSCTFS